MYCIHCTNTRRHGVYLCLSILPVSSTAICRHINTFFLGSVITHISRICELVLYKPINILLTTDNSTKQLRNRASGNFTLPVFKVQRKGIQMENKLYIQKYNKSNSVYNKRNILLKNKISKFTRQQLSWLFFLFAIFLYHDFSCLCFSFLF